MLRASGIGQASSALSPRSVQAEKEFDRAGNCNLSVMSPPNNGRFSQRKDFASCTERPWYGVSIVSNKAKKSHISIQPFRFAFTPVFNRPRKWGEEGA